MVWAALLSLKDIITNSNSQKGAALPFSTSEISLYARTKSMRMKILQPDGDEVKARMFGIGDYVECLEVLYVHQSPLGLGTM